jgi:hypothetical protein
MTTNPSISPNIAQSFQFALYHRALHPELFDLRGRRVVRHEGYELECWVFPGGHALRFEHGPACYSEVVGPADAALPQSNVVNAFPCLGEHDLDQHFPRDKVGYITTIQSEQLTENLFLATFEEMRDFARDVNALVYRWDSEAGPCMSMIDVQRQSREVHAQAYHLLAPGGVVLKTQTIFEQR